MRISSVSRVPSRAELAFGDCIHERYGYYCHCHYYLTRLQQVCPPHAPYLWCCSGHRRNRQGRVEPPASLRGSGASRCQCGPRLHCTAVLWAETAGEAEQDPIPAPFLPTSPKAPTHQLGQGRSDDPSAEIALPAQRQLPGKESEFDARALGSQSGLQSRGGTEMAGGSVKS